MACKRSGVQFPSAPLKLACRHPSRVTSLVSDFLFEPVAHETTTLTFAAAVDLIPSLARKEEAVTLVFTAPSIVRLLGRIVTDFLPDRAVSPQDAPGALANLSFVARPSGPLPSVRVPFKFIGLARRTLSDLDFFRDRFRAEDALAAAADTPSMTKRGLPPDRID